MQRWDGGGWGHGEDDDDDGPRHAAARGERDKRHLFGLGSALREEGTEGMLDTPWRLF